MVEMVLVDGEIEVTVARMLQLDSRLLLETKERAQLLARASPTQRSARSRREIATRAGLTRLQSGRRTMFLLFGPSLRRRGTREPGTRMSGKRPKVSL